MKERKNRREEEKKRDRVQFNGYTLVLVTGTNTSVNSTTTRNQTRVKPLISTMLLHNNSLKYIRDYKKICIYRSIDLTSNILVVITIITILQLQKTMKHFPMISFRRLMNHQF